MKISHTKQKIKVVIIHGLLITREFLDTKPRLRAATAKLLRYLPYIGQRLQNLGRDGNYKYEAHAEKELSRQSRRLYRKLGSALDKRRSE